MSAFRKLQDSITAAGPENVYRPILEPNGQLFYEGQTQVPAEVLDEFQRFDFKNKTVLDLGCNFGFYTFMAARQGATRVLGLEHIPQIVSGSRLLAEWYALPQTHFEVDNIEAPQGTYAPFDTVMLIDYFGRACVRKHKIEPILTQWQGLARSELLLMVRPLYGISTELNTSAGSLKRHYPARFIRNDRLDLLGIIADLLGNAWSLRPLSALPGYYQKEKKLVLFIRR